MSLDLVLASASPARLTTLRAAGIDPTVTVSRVDEDAVLSRAMAEGHRTPAEQVLLLAQAKAREVAERVGPETDLVLGCDSMLELDGEVHGKPADAAQATERWRRMRGRSAVLHTGHCLVDLRSAPAGAADGEVSAGSATVVRFADLDDAEIEAYVATGEPLAVAGAFTVDGLGGPFVEGVDGDHHGVVGLSLPLLRRLLGRRGILVTELWTSR